MERDLERELRYHVERRVDELRRSGAGELDARRQAAIEFGGVTQVEEEVRDAWFFGWLDDRRRDMKHAMRSLVRSPGFTITAVLSLALGIGANAAIFSLFDQVVFRRLPVREPERLVLVDWIGSKAGSNWGSGNLMSYPLCRELQDNDRFFEGVFCRHPTVSYVSSDGRPEVLPIEIVSGSYFEVLGVRPEVGRLIARSDDVAPEAQPVVVVSYQYWKSHLGGAPDVAGRKLMINRNPMTIIGVAPESFRGVDPGERPVLWVPAMMNRQANLETIPLESRRAQWMHIFGRLKPGFSAEQVKRGLQPWFRSMLEADLRGPDFPPVTAEQRRSFLASRLEVTPAPEGRSDFRNRMREPLWVLMAGTLVLVLLACVNVANLFIARGAARMGEVTTRLALGASRGRIIWPLLSESLLIALGGGMLSLFVARYVIQLLLSFVSNPISAPLDYRVVLFTFVICVATGGLCGLMPAFQAGRIPLAASLRERSRTTKLGVRFRKALMAGQVAFTLILLIGVGLFVQTLAQLKARGPGFDTTSLLMFRASPVSNGYSDADAKRIMREILAKLESTPGVESAAIANAPLLTGGSSTSGMTIQSGQRIVADRVVHYMRVSPGFFATLGTPFLAGRNFDERDLREPKSKDTAYRSIIVSETFARRYFEGRSPVGYRIGFGNRPDTRTTVEIIGVVKGFSRRNLRDDRDDIEQAFVPYWDGQTGGGSFYVRVRGKPEGAFDSIRAAVAQIDPALPVVDMTTLDDQIARSLTTERMLALLSSGFGAVALLLSVVGLYGVISFVAALRTQEIGIRMALGATTRSAVWLIARDALIMFAAGTVVAFPFVLLLSRYVEGQLFGVHAFDLPTIGVASALVGLVALGSAMLPAWRAASVSPTKALRYD
jgi:predicted permease